MGSFAFIPSVAGTPWINELEGVVAAAVLLAPGFMQVLQHKVQREVGWGGAGPAAPAA